MIKVVLIVILVSASVTFFVAKKKADKYKDAEKLTVSPYISIHEEEEEEDEHNA